MVKILKKDQLKTLIFGFKGRREIPMKYEYLGKGAKNWADLIKSSSYGIGLVESSLIKENIAKIFSNIQKINLVDLGPGEGMKVIPIIKYLQREKKIASYCGIDISKEMLNLARSNIGRETNFSPIITKLGDFEESNFVSVSKELKQNFAKINFLVLFGNTVGNQFDRYRVLLNIRESMTLDDFLLIGLELRKTDNFSKIIKHYEVPEINKMITSNLDELGIDKNSGSVKILFNEKLSQIEAWFVFNKKISIKLGDEKFVFDGGEKILLMISYKAMIPEISKILKETGFELKEVFVSADESYGLLLCKPRHFNL